MSNARTYNCGKELNFYGSSTKTASSSHYGAGDPITHDADRGAAIPSKITLIDNPGTLSFGIHPCDESHAGQHFAAVDYRQRSLFRTQVISDSFYLTLMGLLSYLGVNLPNSDKSDSDAYRRCNLESLLGLSWLTLRIQNLPKELIARRFYRHSLNII